MTYVTSLLARQRAGYPRVHTDRVNLAVHAVTAPLFVVGTALGVAALPLAATGRAAAALAAGLAGISGAVVAVVAQGLGHRRERERPEPFAHAGELALRLFLEQWVTFPRYALGRLRAGRAPRP